MIKELLVWLLVGVCLFCSCEDPVAPETQAAPPVITVDFIPDKTRDATRNILSETDTTIKELNAMYEDIKEEGGDTTAILEELDFFLDRADSLDGLLKIFSSGQVRLDAFSAAGGNFVAAYQDTINDEFVLPLNPNDTESTFFFRYHKLQDTITFHYELKPGVGLDKINLIAFDLWVPYHTFDSLSRHFCQEENCRSSEITYRVYF